MFSFLPPLLSSSVSHLCSKAASALSAALIEDPQGGDHRRPTLLFSAVVVELLTLGVLDVLGVLGVLGVCIFKCGSLAIRGRSFVTRQILTFLNVSARPTWERSSEGFWREYWRDVFEAICHKAFENFKKSSPDPPKSRPRGSKIEP